MPPALGRRESLTRSAAQAKRAKTIVGLEMRALEAQHDIYTTNPAENSGEKATDEDIVAPGVTEELNRLKSMGRACKAPSVDQLTPPRSVYSQKTKERLDDRMVAEGLERELATPCSQDAVFVIPRTALRRGTKIVRGRLVDDTKKVVSRAGSWRPRWRETHGVHAGTPALKALRMIVSLAAMRDGRHRPRSIVFHDIVATFVHASMDEVVGAVPQEGLLERGECFLLLRAPCGTQMASMRWQRHNMRVLRTHGWSSCKVMPGFFHHPDPAALLQRAGVTETISWSKAVMRCWIGWIES